MDQLGQVRIVSRADVALDRNAMGGDEGLERWEKDGRPLGLVKLLPGKKTIVFTVRDLTLEEMLEIDSLPLGAAQVAKGRAFRLGIVSIEGAPKLAADVANTAWRPKAERVTASGHTVPVASWPEMEAIRTAIGYQRVLDVGQFIIQRGNVLGNEEGGAAL